MRRKQELRLEREVLASRGKGQRCYSKHKRKLLGSFNHALFNVFLILHTNSDIFPATTTHLSHLCISKIPHTTIKLVSLSPSKLESFTSISWGFSLGIYLCFDVGKFYKLKSSFASFFFSWNLPTYSLKMILVAQI